MLKVIWNDNLSDLKKKTNKNAGQLILFIVIITGSTQINCVCECMCVCECESVCECEWECVCVWVCEW